MCDVWHVLMKSLKLRHSSKPLSNAAMNAAPKAGFTKSPPQAFKKRAPRLTGASKLFVDLESFLWNQLKVTMKKNPNLNHFLQLICSESSRFQHSWPSPNYLSSHWARSHHRSLRWRAAGGSRRGRETTAWPQNQPMQKPTWEPYKNQPLVAKKIGNLANWPSMTNTKQVKPRFLVLQWFHYHCLHAIPGALGSTVRHLILQVVHPLRGPEVDWRWLKMIEASRLHLSMIQWISSPCLKILHWQIGPEKIHQNPLVKGPGSSQLRQPPAKTRSQEPACWASKGSWIPIIITIYLDILSLSNPPTKYSLVYLVEHWLRYECVVYIYIYIDLEMITKKTWHGMPMNFATSWAKSGATPRPHWPPFGPSPGCSCVAQMLQFVDPNWTSVVIFGGIL